VVPSCEGQAPAIASPFRACFRTHG